MLGTRIYQAWTRISKPLYHGLEYPSGKHVSRIAQSPFYNAQVYPSTKHDLERPYDHYWVKHVSRMAQEPFCYAQVYPSTKHDLEWP